MYFRKVGVRIRDKASTSKLLPANQPAKFLCSKKPRTRLNEGGGGGKRGRSNRECLEQKNPFRTCKFRLRKKKKKQRIFKYPSKCFGRKNFAIDFLIAKTMISPLRCKIKNSKNCLRSLKNQLSKNFTRNIKLNRQSRFIYT